MTEF
ncbi:hypothetical protein YPPY101_1567, partial [Yersinia pestis PY-101]|jgi:outer membrane immunogenic protein